MAVLNGSKVILKFNDAVSAGVQLVGGQRSVSFSANNALIDISNKDSANTDFMGGRYSETVNLSAFYVIGDAGYAYLQTAVRTGASLTMERWQADTNALSPALSESATCFVTSLGENYSAEGAGEVDVTLQVSGAWS
jgi:TP901-1 family phage major tail protein